MNDKEKLEIAITALKEFMDSDNWNYETDYGPHGSFNFWTWCGIPDDPSWLAERALDDMGELDE